MEVGSGDELGRPRQVTSGLAQPLLYSIVASVQQFLSAGHFWSRAACLSLQVTSGPV